MAKHRNVDFDRLRFAFAVGVYITRSTQHTLRCRALAVRAAWGRSVLAGAPVPSGCLPSSTSFFLFLCADISDALDSTARSHGQEEPDYLWERDYILEFHQESSIAEF